MEDCLNTEVERLKAELDRLQNDNATLVKKLKNLESNHVSAVTQAAEANDGEIPR